MTDPSPPPGYTPAGFTPGFLDHGGPYFLGPKRKAHDTVRSIGLRVMAHHINYQDAAHGGVISTLADVALSHAVHDAERPRLAPSTVTLTVNYLNPAKLGDWMETQVRIDRIGGRTAYTSGLINCGQTVIATMSGVFAFRRA